MKNVDAIVQQLVWTPFLLLLLGVAILSHGTTRIVATAAAIGGAVVMGLVFISMAVAG